MACVFRVLGPVECTLGDRPIALGGPKQRAVLAVLLLERGHVVSVDRLIETVWGDEAGDGARNVIQVYVSNLRRALEPVAAELGRSALIETRRPGYLLDVPEDLVDVAVFERLLGEARRRIDTGEAAAAAGQLQQALAAFTGSPLADVATEGNLRAAAVRLDALRLGADVDLLEIQLGLGQLTPAVERAGRLAAEHPLDERICGLFMLALYRSGRQADALATFQRCRELLIDELGLEPGTELRRLEGLVLRQDPELEGARARPAVVEDLSTILGRSVLIRRGALLLGGRRIPLGPSVTTIGRRADRDVVLDDGRSSRDHAEIRHTADGFVFRDVGSSNGTSVGGVRIDGPYTLRDGDVIVIGATEIVYVGS